MSEQELLKLLKQISRLLDLAYSHHPRQTSSFVIGNASSCLGSLSTHEFDQLVNNLTKAPTLDPHARQLSIDAIHSLRQAFPHLHRHKPR